MTKVVSILLLVFIAFAVQAQQHPSYTQYTLNRFALNPAVAGLVPCADVTVGNRKQWVGFDDAPNHYFASFNTRLNKDDKFPGNFHGVGFYVSNDRDGFNENTRVKLAYSYHLKVSRNWRASFGIFGGIQQQKFNLDAVRVRNIALDPVFDDEETAGYVYPEISPGAFLHNNNFFLGLSYFQAFPARNKVIGTKDNRLTGHAFFTGGYRFRGRDLHIIPSFLMSFSPVISPTVDLTLTADYKERISFALGSKYLNSAYATLQFSLGTVIAVGYSFEYALNEISNVAPVTHEIVLRFRGCGVDQIKEKVMCPAYQ